MRDDTAPAPVRVSLLHPVAVVVRLASPVARHRVLLQGAVADVALLGEQAMVDLGVHHHFVVLPDGVPYGAESGDGLHMAECRGARSDHRGQG